MKPKKREVKSQNIHVEVDMSVTMSVRQKGHNIAMRGRNGRQFKKVCDNNSVWGIWAKIIVSTEEIVEIIVVMN
jgi:hypothetical protein